MIRLAVLLKFYGIVASLASVFLVVNSLPTSQAELYLGLVALNQLFIPFIGFGTTHYYVGKEDSTLILGVSTTQQLLILASLALHLVLVFSFGLRFNENFAAISSYSLILFFLIVLSEFSRVRFEYQVGFFIVNTVNIVLSVSVIILDKFVLQMLLLPVLGSLVMIFVLHSRGVRLSKSENNDFYFKESIVKSLKVSFLNQYYNLIAILLLLVGSITPAVSLLLVYKLNVVFNWQVFYWLRFAHKRTLLGFSKINIKQNRRIGAISIAFVFFVNVAVQVLHRHGVFEWFGINFVTPEFVTLLLIYSCFKITLALTFPFEYLAVYNPAYSQRKLLIFPLLFAITMVAVLYIESVIVCLIAFELLLLGLRLFSGNLAELKQVPIK